MLLRLKRSFNKVFTILCRIRNDSSNIIFINLLFKFNSGEYNQKTEIMSCKLLLFHFKAILLQLLNSTRN